jgi:rfaE bifunctional protein kinase chain/domain
VAVTELSGATVLVVGDLMLDQYLWGDVTRVSPEAPVPIVEISRRSVAAGGAGNAAAGVAALGGCAVLAGVLGADTSAALLREALVKAGVALDGILTDPGRETTTKSRLIARGQHVVRMDSEDRSPLPARLGDDLLRFVRARVRQADAVLLSDYAKGTLSGGLVRAVTELARRHGKPVVADPAGEDYRAYRGVSVVAPSTGEVERAVGRPIRTEAELQEAGCQLARLLPGTSVLITRGAQGMWLMSGTAVALDLPARARSVYDITGAGDTVVATLAVALARGVPMRAAVVIANVAAGIVVGKAGTASVTLDELAQELPEGEPLRSAPGRMFAHG